MDHIIEVSGLNVKFGEQSIFEQLDFSAQAKQIIALVGGSGAGKSTLFNCLLRLLKPSSGNIRLFGQDLLAANHGQAQQLRQRWGVLFQQSALFSSLTVLENIMFPMIKVAGIKPTWAKKLAMMKLNMVGLASETSVKYPAELSGGMQKRAALARAIALDPELLFLDEPSAGLDPVAAGNLDSLVRTLRDTLGLTVVMITHDLASLWQVTDEVAFMADKRIVAQAPMSELVNNNHPVIQTYFGGPRGDGRKL